MSDEAQGPAAEAGGGNAGQVPGSLPRLAVRVRELEGQLSEAEKAIQRARRKSGHAQWSMEPQGEPEEEGWLTVYLDMMTLMLVLLVVMLAFSGKGSLDRVQKAASAVLHAHEGILPARDGLLPESALQVPTPLPKPPDADPLKGLPLDQLGKDIEVVVNESTVSFRISSEILFSSGQADLSLAGLAVLRHLVPVFNSTDHRVMVEGHTDSMPIRSGRYPSNWELSGARAGSVVRYLEANGVASKRLRAVGYADTKPLADNASAEGRANNRRVELVMEKPEK